MKITLNDLIAKTDTIEKFDAINRWQSKFHAIGKADAFDELLFVGEIDAEGIDLDLMAKKIKDSSFVSSDSKRFIEESYDPANLGKTSDELCREFGLNIERVKAERFTEAFKSYAEQIITSDVDGARAKTVLLVHTTLQKMLIESPHDALKYISRLLESSVLFAQDIQDAVDSLNSGAPVLSQGGEFDPSKYISKKQEAIDVEFE